LDEKVKFCPNCGQKATYKHLSIKNLFKNFFDSFLNFDVKLFRSLRDVWIPNKMVKTYISGNRIQYLNPFRFYFISLLIFFALVSLNTKSESFGEVDAHNLRHELEMYQSFQKKKEKIAGIVGNEGVVDSIERQIFRHKVITAERDTNDLEISILNMDLDITRADKYTMSADEIFKKYNIEGTLNKFIIKQLIKIELEPGVMMRHTISNMLWGIILTTGILALILKLLYWRHSIFFVEHFFLVSHFHCLTLLLVSVLLAVNYFVNVPEVFFVISVLSGFLYFFYSLKEYTRQGWIKTFIKAVILLFTYILAISVVLTIILFFTMIIL